MSTSDGSPLDTGDVTALRALAGYNLRAPVTLPSGRVMDPVEAQALSSALGPPSDIGANLPERARKLRAEATFRMEVEPWEDRQRPPVVGVILLFTMLALGVAVCLAAVVANWPHPQP